jgi:hypothetical protein
MMKTARFRVREHVSRINPTGVHTVEVTGSNPVLPTRPVPEIGVMFEEPAAT